MTEDVAIQPAEPLQDLPPGVAENPAPTSVATARGVLAPLAMRNLTLRNRVLRSSISGRFDLEDGTPTQTRLNWETLSAEGGVGAIITSYVPVLMSGRDDPRGSPDRAVVGDRAFGPPLRQQNDHATVAFRAADGCAGRAEPAPLDVEFH
jgi:hypothetical protein